MEAATWVRGELLYQRDADAIRVASRPGALRYHVTHLPNRALRLRMSSRTLSRCGACRRANGFVPVYDRLRPGC